jgi:DNA ligase-1
MRTFCRLVQTLDDHSSDTVRVAALVRYLRSAAVEDAAWAVWLLSGNKPATVCSVARLTDWFRVIAPLPEWLLEECRTLVGDVCETLALLHPAQPVPNDRSLSWWMNERLRPIAALTDDEQAAAVACAWQELTAPERFVFNRLLTGRPLVRGLGTCIATALARRSGCEPGSVLHRLSQDWVPTVESFAALTAQDESPGAPLEGPFPFLEARRLTSDEWQLMVRDGPLSAVGGRLGDWSQYVVSGSRDGLRAQLLWTHHECRIWSHRGERQLAAEQALTSAAASLADGTALDGWLIATRAGQVVPPDEWRPSEAQRPRRAKTGMRPEPADTLCWRFEAWDVLANAGRDLRSSPLSERLQVLRGLKLPVAAADGLNAVGLSYCDARPATSAKDVEAWLSACDVSMRGLLLRDVTAPYAGDRPGFDESSSAESGETGRLAALFIPRRPQRCLAVVLYGHRRGSRQSGTFEAVTVGGWLDGELVPLARLEMTLPGELSERLDTIFHGSTRERFGPVHHVEAQVVLEIEFDSVRLSTRHKSGVILFEPRIVRWLEEQTPAAAIQVRDLLAGGRATREATGATRAAMESSATVPACENQRLFWPREAGFD